MNIVFASSEVFPFSKTGGLADVSESLPVALNKKGINVTIITPLYKTIDKDTFNIKNSGINLRILIDYSWQEIAIFKTEYKGINIYFLGNDTYFNVSRFYEGDSGARFGLFCYGVIELSKKLDLKPDIFHLNDWQTALVSVLLKSNYKYIDYFKRVKTLLTIHNLAYQGFFQEDILNRLNIDKSLYNINGLEFYSQVNFLKGGIIFSDYISTVSPTYAEEILTYEAGRGLHGVLKEKKDKLYGILNGIDIEVWNPDRDRMIYQCYNFKEINKKYINKINLQKELNLEIEKDIPVYSFVGRLTEQKGIDLLIDIIKFLMCFKKQIIILGEGEKSIKDRFLNIKEKYIGKLSFNFHFDENLARKIYAGSDFFLMPSRFEPCGIGQMISMRYGTVPIVRNVGGLKDTVKDNVTGFVFNDFDEKEFFNVILKAGIIYNNDKKRFEKIVKNCMEVDSSWEKSSQEYIKLYEKMKFVNHDS